MKLLNANSKKKYSGQQSRSNRIEWLPRLLILGDWGMAVLNPDFWRDPLEVIEESTGLRSTIVSAQLPVHDWHNVFAGNTVSDAELYRLVHNAYRFELQGPSKRPQEAIRTTESDAAKSISK